MRQPASRKLLCLITLLHIDGLRSAGNSDVPMGEFWYGTDVMARFNPWGNVIRTEASAAGMGALELKQNYGDRLVFWGGGVDIQRTLPFGTAAEVPQEVRERLRAFGPGRGFVFSTVHNIQALTSVANILALYEATQAPPLSDCVVAWGFGCGRPSAWSCSTPFSP